MSDLKIVHRAGWFGLVAFAVFFLELVLRTVPGSPPPFSDPAAHAQFLAGIRGIALTWVLLDMAMYVCLMVFWAGLRHLIVKARAEYEWAATLALVAGGVWWAVSLVADGLEGAAVLSSIPGRADPMVVRALREGTLLIYNGAIAFATTGLFMGAAGYAILGSGALPRWMGWFALGSAALCAISIPAMYADVVDPTAFYNAAGWGPMIAANIPPLLWFVTVAVAMVRKRSLAPA